MNVERLRVLRELADRGTVGATAEALSMTPSAVSQQLKLLTKEAGVALLEPDGRRVRLTAAGRALVPHADDVLAALGRASDEMASYRGSARGTVRLALFPSGAALLLPGVLDRLSGAGVVVDARDEDVPASSVPALLADYDVVLTHRDERAPTIASERVEVRTLMREPIDLVLPPSHPLAHRESVDIEELSDEQWISVRGGFPVDDVLLSIATVTGVTPRVIMRINDFRLTEELVAHGHGIALMPRYASAHPRVAKCRLAGVKAARIYDVATRPRAAERPAVAAVLDALEAQVAAVAP
ncbi:LysR family transcriptional regulator [Rhodococcus sp. Leaf7]|uniref:LysR family transcriptional regulator n=1 Tax=unclassified Rhodococcus (in: high G+C Gram-positive bacteria) TaxID=192944 RepID=UPI0005AC7B46|nr:MULTISPECIES: LysR family transcriptional regulator [unclassified Rhodococcus (in: high G+C Gram-positive bacteria)]KIQ13502.1 LysR family transcriptional regulator [Rhodococcus sp. MEB064]KQU07563.1 LysR family transcriptional regulator [Rhodococcus sp. Leaf7]KQU43083.1 LysR family transcriptional regulator [Rhodococcus sp. Leaf247]